MWYKNGILVSEKEKERKHLEGFDYHGVGTYRLFFPLIRMRDAECRKLSDEQFSIEVEPGWYFINNFISNMSLFKRYIQKCKELDLDVRVLFVESYGYEAEIWQDELPEMEFIGYEFCPIPFDDQVVTDLEFHKPLEVYKKKLNKFGLFDSCEDLIKFIVDYQKEEEKGEIGDGGFDGYICKLYNVKI